MRLTEATKSRILQELTLDMDLVAASKRVGISSGQLAKLRKDARFMKKVEKGVSKGVEENGGIEESVRRFRRTQDVLSRELESGNVGVASSLMKSHEIEFKMHGLFEKDNNQKNSPVQINVSFYDDKKVGVIGEGVVSDE